MDKGKSAMRSNMSVHLDQELAEEPVLELEEENVETEEKINEVYASLAENAGWQLIKSEFETTIAAYRSGRTIQEAIKQGKTNTEVGELTRTSNAVADELEKIILTVETAVEQVGVKRGRTKRKV